MNDSNFHIKHDFHPELIFDDFDDKSWLDETGTIFKTSKNGSLWWIRTFCNLKS